ncbi:helix-turn-helix domain-containing protein [Streptomyces sp. NPDC093595]|uniref:helix-turn-helix domain-containing protein n=1 Tax=Streptomyces sp. NPDC093595 TaxID=3366045 RepID=UPI0038298389
MQQEGGDDRGGYRERPSRFGGAVVWTTTVRAAADGPPRAVLPDGCMDLLWTGGRLLVAGPDTRAHVPRDPGARYAGLRFAPGDAPRFFGVPAHELRDLRVELDALWPARRVRQLAERVTQAPDPAAALEELALRSAAGRTGPDPLLRAVVAGLRAGQPVGATAAAVGLGARALHRRSLEAFGYGPKTLARILRLQRALALVRAGVPYARAAAEAGCTDQAHLAREMRSLAGTTLSAYTASAKRETPQPSGSSTTA